MLGARESELSVVSPGPAGINVLVRAAGSQFAVQVVTRASAAAVRDAAARLHNAIRMSDGSSIPLVAVPFMGEVGRRVCQDNAVNWLDFSGNGRIVAEGLRIYVQGQPNRFKSSGRPENMFAPKSARLTRCLLVHWPEGFTQRELAYRTGIGEGFVSRIVRRLASDGYVERRGGTVRVADPLPLLDAWRERYEFSGHRIIRGHVAARTSERLVFELAAGFAESSTRYALTGLGAAWLYSPFASYNTVAMYVAAFPSNALKGRLRFHEADTGANVWLVVPNDDGVFHGEKSVSGVRCVHPVQVYLDLKEHPERAGEAAEALRVEVLRKTWSKDE